MQYLVNFGTDVANTLIILIPVFCYVAGGTLCIIAVVAMASAGKEPRQGMAHHAGILATLVVASLLLSFDTVVNLFSATLGGSSTISLGGGPLAYSTASGATTTLKDSILTLVANFTPVLMAIGCLFVLMGLLKLRRIGRGSGRPGFSAAVHIVCGVVLLNIHQIVSAVIGS